MPTNVETTGNADAEVVQAADALIAALARANAAIDAADDAMRHGQRPEPYRSLMQQSDEASKDVISAALRLAALPAHTSAGVTARGRALFAWFDGNLEWPHPGLKPEPEDVLFRALVGDVLRVFPHDMQASKAD